MNNLNLSKSSLNQHSCKITFEGFGSSEPSAKQDEGTFTVDFNGRANGLTFLPWFCSLARSLGAAYEHENSSELFRVFKNGFKCKRSFSHYSSYLEMHYDMYPSGADVQTEIFYDQASDWTFPVDSYTCIVHETLTGLNNPTEIRSVGSIYSSLHNSRIAIATVYQSLDNTLNDIEKESIASFSHSRETSVKVTRLFDERSRVGYLSSIKSFPLQMM